MHLHSSRPTSSSSTRYSDRFIPHRSATQDLRSRFSLLHPYPSSTSHSHSENNASLSNHPPSNPTPSPYALLLKSHLLDSPPSPSSSISTSHHSSPCHPRSSSSKRRARVSSTSHLSTTQAPTQWRNSAPPTSNPTSHHTQNLLRFSNPPAPTSSSRTVSMSFPQPHPALPDSRRALLQLSSPSRVSRKIARAPFKVLDAPSLQDDFYLNLVDWSAQNVLAVGLGSCVYLWSAHTSVVTKLCDLQFVGPVCSVGWSLSGGELAVGTMTGAVQVWDVTAGTMVRSLGGHEGRASCLAWSSGLLSSGGRDNEILNRDLRCKEAYVGRLSGHKQEVCGLKWSPDEMQLASGGNDNRLLIWNAGGAGGTGDGKPAMKFSYHEAAVKAIAWSPHARGLVASGGGTADKKIRFWNTITGSALAAVDTGSQVCNLAWSKNVNEIVSTHGYSQNQIVVWKYPTLSKVVTLLGHSCRVLYLAMSPSGETIVTGAGDETLRFWNVFPSAKSKRGSGDSDSQLSPSRMSIR